MALSDDASALAYVRAEMGDASSTTYEVSNDMLDYIYANKADGDIDKTIAIALRQKCTALSNKVAQTNVETGQTIQRQQEREAICAKAKEWAKATGVAIGSNASSIGTFEISLGIDEEDENYSNP